MGSSGRSHSDSRAVPRPVVAPARETHTLRRQGVPKRDVRHALTAVCGTADGTRRSTVGTLNMCIWAGTGEALA
eukprot:1851286-Prymnesium_polylepis.2